MFSLSSRRLVVALGLAVASMGATGGAAQAILNHGGNFSVTAPITAVVPIGVCSAQSVGTSNNVNRGEVSRSDAKTWTTSESHCNVANNIARSVSTRLNKSNTRNSEDDFC